MSPCVLINISVHKCLLNLRNINRKNYNTWLENKELGTMTGSFSGLINEVEVSPISTTLPSIGPAYNVKLLLATVRLQLQIIENIWEMNKRLSTSSPNWPFMIAESTYDRSVTWIFPSELGNTYQPIKCSMHKYYEKHL